MKKRTWIILASVVGALALLYVVFVVAAPFWVSLGVQPVCVETEGLKIRLVDCPDGPAVAARGTPVPQVTPLPPLPPEVPGGAPLIFDDDGSPDGMTALMFLLRNPQFDLRAVTISYGEAHPAVFAPRMAQVLVGLGRGDIPVGAGSETPLSGSNAFPDAWREASDAFWGVTTDEGGTPQAVVPAAQLIVDTVRASDVPVVIFVSGAHTNLAEALRLDPGIRDNIRSVVIMGGAVYVGGNIRPEFVPTPNSAAEWNIFVDPQAAAEVFASGLELHLAPLDSTQNVTWNKGDVRDWLSGKSPESALAARLLERTLQNWGADEVQVWDLATAVLAANPAVCAETHLALQVITDPGSEQGRTAPADGAPNVWACLKMDAAQVKAQVTAILSR